MKSNRCNFFSFGFKSFASRSLGKRWNRLTMAAMSLTSFGDFFCTTLPGTAGAASSSSSNQYLMCSSNFFAQRGTKPLREEL